MGAEIRFEEGIQKVNQQDSEGGRPYLTYGEPPFFRLIYPYTQIQNEEFGMQTIVTILMNDAGFPEHTQMLEISKEIGAPAVIIYKERIYVRDGAPAESVYIYSFQLGYKL